MQHDTWWMVLGFVIISEIHSALAAWERTCTPFTKSFGPHPRGLCGSNIDETLSFLCVGGYNDHNHRRHHRGKRHLDKELLKSRLGGKLIPREQANSYLVKRSNFYERGIVCECCYHNCRLMELFSYCRNVPGLFGIFKRSVDRQNQLGSHTCANDDVH